MVAPLRPASVKHYLRDKWIWVPSGAYDGAAPSLAILTGGTALDVTKMFFATSAALNPTQNTNVVRNSRRAGDDGTYEFIGETQRSLGEIRYQYNPQSAPGADQLKAYEKLIPFSTGWLVNRRGIDRDTDLAATTQRVSSYPAELGPQMEVPEGENEAAEEAISQMVALTGPIFPRVVILT